MNPQQNLEITAARIASLDLVIAYGKNHTDEFITPAVDRMSAYALVVKTAYVTEALTGKVEINSKFTPDQLDFIKGLSLDDLISLRNSLITK